MNKKLSIKETMKPVIGALKDGKRSWRDLKELKVQKREIPDKTLARLLENLEYWSLVKKEGSYWVWYENMRVFSSKDEYDLAIQHSRKLFSGIEQILQYRQQHDFIYSAVKEHLKSYPETSLKMEKFEEEFAKLHGKLVQNKDVFQKHFNPEMGGPFGFMPFYDEWKPTAPGEIGLKDELGKELEKLLKIYGPLSGDFSVLELKIEMGQPLEGTCPLCPKIKITK